MQKTLVIWGFALEWKGLRSHFGDFKYSSTDRKKKPEENRYNVNELN